MPPGGHQAASRGGIGSARAGSPGPAARYWLGIGRYRRLHDLHRRAGCEPAIPPRGWNRDHDVGFSLVHPAEPIPCHYRCHGLAHTVHRARGNGSRTGATAVGGTTGQRRATDVHSVLQRHRRAGNPAPIAPSAVQPPVADRMWRLSGTFRGWLRQAYYHAFLPTRTLTRVPRQSFAGVHMRGSICLSHFT